MRITEKDIKFEVGDSVISVDTISGYLTFGKAYTILNVSRIYSTIRVEVVLDDGFCHYCYSDRFKHSDNIFSKILKVI